MRLDVYMDHSWCPKTTPRDVVHKAAAKDAFLIKNTDAAIMFERLKWVRVLLFSYLIWRKERTRRGYKDIANSSLFREPLFVEKWQ